ncbi:MAG: hypothetical protein LBI18_04620 [Planctomycetaceae bacterium]|nr:hypothetical protein [Planctomycetaceae bacterium]
MFEHSRKFFGHTRKLFRVQCFADMMVGESPSAKHHPPLYQYCLLLGGQPFAEGFSSTVALSLGNSDPVLSWQLDSKPLGHTNCLPTTGSSRLSPTRPWMKILRRKVAHLKRTFFTCK